MSSQPVDPAEHSAADLAPAVADGPHSQGSADTAAGQRAMQANETDEMRDQFDDN